MSTPAPVVVLVGLSGTGKSTVAPLLAERLGGVAEDVDLRLRDRLGASAQEVFERDGEAVFRSEESAELAAVVDRAARRDVPLVVAAGGGIVLAPENRRALEGTTVVWLRAAAPELARRLRGTAEQRPLLAADPLATLERLGSERGDLYREVADVVVDVDGLRADEVADRIATELGDRR